MRNSHEHRSSMAPSEICLALQSIERVNNSFDVLVCRESRS